MSPSPIASRSPRRRGALALLCAAAALGAPARAQECALSVHATPQVLSFGQQAEVETRAHVSPRAGTFAAVELDVLSSGVAWTHASAGTIADDGVVGVVYSVPSPDGLSAGSAVPARIGTGPLASRAGGSNGGVWKTTSFRTGRVTPLSGAPALVDLAADPASFLVRTAGRDPSLARCDAAPGETTLFVNPLRLGSWLAAPGRGTEIHVGDDVVVDGRIVTGEDPPSVRIGLLLPAVQKVYDDSVRVSTDAAPDGFVSEIRILAAASGESRPMESLSLNYEKATWRRMPSPDGGAYEASADFSPPGRAQVRFWLDGRPVATSGGEAGAALYTVDRVPDVIASGPEPRSGVPGAVPYPPSLRHASRYDRPAGVRLPDGRSFLADTIEVSRTGSASGNNIRNISIAVHTAHVLEASGVTRLTLAPARP